MGAGPVQLNPVAIRRGRCLHGSWRAAGVVRAPAANTPDHSPGTVRSAMGRSSPSSLVEYLGNMWGPRRGPTDSAPAAAQTSAQVRARFHRSSRRFDPTTAGDSPHNGSRPDSAFLLVRAGSIGRADRVLVQDIRNPCLTT